MDESPFEKYADILVNHLDASAQCLQSFVMSMYDGEKYKFSAEDLVILSEPHFAIFIELAQSFRAKGKDDLPFRETCLRMIEQRPDYTERPYFLYPFPDPKDVFVPDQAELSQHLHPLFAINLYAVNPEWSGHIFMLSPLEPDEHHLVGDATEDTRYHSKMLQTNWIGFKLENGRYRLMGDPRYFFLHEDNEHLLDPYPGARSELIELYQAQRAAFAAVREAYERTGRLHSPDVFRQELGLGECDHLPFVERIGGDVDIRQVLAGNMSVYFEKSMRNGITPVYPRSPSGRPFYHVASVPAYHYQQTGADKIIMFYEPVEQLVLFTFYWEKYSEYDAGRYS